MGRVGLRGRPGRGPSHLDSSEQRAARGAGLGLRLDDPVADRVADESCGGRQVELAHDRRAMRLHGLEADVENVGDLLVGVTFGDQLHHAASRLVRGRSLPGRPRQKRIQQGLGDLGREERLVRGERFDGADQVALGVRFEQIAPRARFQELLNSVSLSCIVKMRTSVLGSRARICRVASMPFTSGNE